MGLPIVLVSLAVAGFQKQTSLNQTHTGDNSRLEGIFVDLRKSSQGYINILQKISHLSLLE